MSGCIYFFKSKTKNNIILDWGIKNKFKFKRLKIKVTKLQETTEKYLSKKYICEKNEI